MSFDQDKLKLIGEFDVLKQQGSQTHEVWNDPVQRRFYEQFVDNLPKEFNSYIASLDKLENSFSSAEQKIKDLLHM